MLKKLLLIISIALCSLSFIATPTLAKNEVTSTGEATRNTKEATSDTKDCRYFLGMTSWDCNTNLTNNDNITEDELKTGIWTAVANVATDVTIIAAYLVLGYVIYGGYLYIFSNGESSKTASGKKTLIHAFLGLAIVMMANIIMTAIRVALGANFTENCTKGTCTAPEVMVTNAISWIVGITGVAAVIFIVIGGIGYMTSAGDSNKLKKAKDTILYACIGLAICALAEIITAFVSNTIREAKNNSSSSSLITPKEEHDNQIS